MSRFGWLGPELEKRARDSLRRRGLLYTFSEAVQQGILRNSLPEDPIIREPIWKLCERVLGADILPGTQEIGDCVAWGMVHAGERRQVIEIAAGQEERWRRWYAPWIYAVSRNQIGGGIDGDGSLGLWAAEAVSRYGVLFADDEGVPPYSGEISRQWGHRRNVREPVYSKFFNIARDNPCVVVEVRTVPEVVSMIRDYRRPLTIASLQGFLMQPRVYRGHHVFVPSGTWAHQMALIEYNAELPAVYRLNSWGPDAHGKPLNGETPGGAWNLLDDLDRELSRGQVEVFALVEFTGEEGTPDHRILGGTYSGGPTRED